jgi:hypothetical protein
VSNDHFASSSRLNNETNNLFRFDDSLLVTYCSNPTIQATCPSETLAEFRRNTGHYHPEERTVHVPLRRWRNSVGIQGVIIQKREPLSRPPRERQIHQYIKVLAVGYDPNESGGVPELFRPIG